MKKGVSAIVLTGLLVSSVFLSGCVISIDDDDYGYDDDNHSSWSKMEKDNRQKISMLSPGTSISSVRSTMGTPDFDELIVKGDKEHRVLFYRTQRTESDGITSKDECTPILFVNGELAGFGETALNSI